MNKLIIPLTTDPECSIDLIIPSIPRFGFSQKINTPDCNLWFIGDLWSKLIKELGYEKVLAQGGDFGAAIGLTAAFSKALSEVGISCNVVAAFYHDHIFVDKKDVARAIETLNKLSE